MDEFFPRSQTAENREMQGGKDKVPRGIEWKEDSGIFKNLGAKKSCFQFILTTMHFEISLLLHWIIRI